MEIVVFTNGCFDILHPGHVELLKKARQMGTKLVVGLNSDRSVRAIKGSPRPFFNQEARASLLRELRAVDEVRIFDENTPEKLINDIKPDVLVKGGDWAIDQIVGADFVLKTGGKVFSIPFESDYSSSKIVEKIKDSKSVAFMQIKASGSEYVESLIKEYIEVFQILLENQVENIFKCADLILKTVQSENKILFCGDEKSAVMVRNATEEFSKNFRHSGTVAAVNPTFEVSDFARDNLKQNLSQQIGKAREGDLLIVFKMDTEPNEAVISGVMQARQMNCKIVCLTGSQEKKLASLCDANVSTEYKNADQFKVIHQAIISILLKTIHLNLNNNELVR